MLRNRLETDSQTSCDHPGYRHQAYADQPLPIGHGQTISQPYVVALMTELAQPKPESRVLDVGTGSGYQAAVLAELVEEVYSIEIVEPFANSSMKVCCLSSLRESSMKVCCLSSLRES